VKNISTSNPNWDREKIRQFWDPSRKLLRSIRKYQKAKSQGLIGLVISKYWVIVHRFWSVITGAEIDLNCKIGGGLLLPHPNGIVIHPNTVVGVNCLIFQQVTLAGGEEVLLQL
jgi:serine O-acetyltransferase